MIARQSNLTPTRWGAFNCPTKNEQCKNSQRYPSESLRLRRDALVELVIARGASRLRVFGSVARGEDHEGSDVDLLVDMPTGASLLQLEGLQLELQDALGAPVDLRTERELHPMLRDRILAEARLV